MKNETLISILAVIAALNFSGCSAMQETASWLGFGDDKETKEQERLVETSETKRVVAVNVYEDVLLAPKKRDEWKPSSIDFNGVTDKRDIEQRVAEWEKECKEERQAYVCNAVGKYYLENGKPSKAQEFYSLACKGKEKYGCGVVEYLNAGGR